MAPVGGSEHKIILWKRYIKPTPHRQTHISAEDMASPLISYAVTLHQSTDYREKQYKVFQYVAKLLALQPGMDPRVGKVAATLSQSRGIFKIFKWVTCLEDYQKADGEKQVWLRRVKSLRPLSTQWSQ